MALPLLFCFILVGTAITLLVSANSFLSALPLAFHESTFINSILRYQLFALVLALAASGITIIFRPESKDLLRFGDVSKSAEQEVWLGINGATSWKRNAAQLLVVISLATGIFMALAVWQSGATHHFQWWFLPWILLFSCTNAFSEELIFRFVVNGSLSTIVPKIAVLLISAVLFGLPHYNGFPNGVIGVIMAGVLGYVLSKATYETGGLGIALMIHIVQDCIIFTAMFMMKAR